MNTEFISMGMCTNEVVPNSGNVTEIRSVGPPNRNERGRAERGDATGTNERGRNAPSVSQSETGGKGKRIERSVTQCVE